MRPRDVGVGVQLFHTRTPTLPPATHTNSYALGRDKVLLVEPATPYADERRAWLAWAREMPSHGRTPVAIVLTHHHEDHIGGAAFLSRELHLPLWAHAETRKRLPESMRIERSLEDGDMVLDSWRVLHTPGHAPGHICLHDEETGALVCGDMVASIGTILIAPGDGDMLLYLAQLRRLEALGASLALPAHGDPIREPTEVFKRYVTHRLMREAKVLAAVTTEGRAVADILGEAYADTPVRLWPVAALSLQSHLDKLVVEGRVTRGAENVYRLTS
jgi:ribonuclease/clavin/mitogillin